jgi:hypothetical protein
MSNKPLNPRTERVPKDGEPQYILADGAPQHYVAGYGLCGAGAIVTLQPGVEPGKWYVEINPEDAAKAESSEVDRQRLAALAAAKIKAKGNQGDAARKRQLDEAALSQQQAAIMAAGESEAAAILRAGQAEQAAREATDQLTAANDRASQAEKELAATQQQLAELQQQAEKMQAAQQAADKAQPEGKDAKGGDKK